MRIDGRKDVKSYIPNGSGLGHHNGQERNRYVPIFIPRIFADSSRLLPGTDATIAQHIQTIIDREYVVERMEGSTKYLVPSKLGIGLIEGYNQIGFDKSLSKPQLRREVFRYNLSPPSCSNPLD